MLISMENTRVSCERSLRQSLRGGWIVSLVLFLAAAGAGYALQQADGGEAVAVKNALTAGDIFLNNLSMLGVSALGAFLLGIPNLISGLMNGYALGSYVCLAGRQFGTGWMLRALLPHGWLEIPVILTAISFGTLPWIYMAHRMRFPERSRRSLAGQLGRYLLFAALACAAALLLAPVLEANVSMKMR